MPYGWLNNAPIRQVDQAVVDGIATTLRQQIGRWGQGSENWDNTRRHHTNKLGADQLLQTIEITGGEEFSYVYDYGGMVLGLLLASRGLGYLYVNDLLAHPGTEGAGATLLEFAVNLSQREGFQAKLKLDSLDGNSSGFYLRMGFVRVGPATPEGGGTMMLDPVTCHDLWVRQGGGEWALKAYVGKKFAGQTG
jgi:hypothetical protein